MPRFEYQCFLIVDAKDELSAASEALRAQTLCENNALLLSLEDGPPEQLDDEEDD